MNGVCRYQEVFSYIKITVAINNRMPTYKEIIYDLGITRKVVFRILKRLEKDGKINRQPNGIIPFKLLGK